MKTLVNLMAVIVLLVEGGGYQTFFPLVQNDIHTTNPEVVLDLVHQFEQKEMELYDYVHQPGGGTMNDVWVLEGQRKAIYRQLMAEIGDTPVESLPWEARWFFMHCWCAKEDDLG